MMIVFLQQYIAYGENEIKYWLTIFYRYRFSGFLLKQPATADINISIIMIINVVRLKKLIRRRWNLNLARRAYAIVARNFRKDFFTS
jgi:hypothetical protein